MELTNEQELKVIITKQLFDELTYNSVGKIQINYYFADGDIFARVRKSDGKYILTYKKRQKSVGNIFKSIEYNQDISYEEFFKFINCGISSEYISNTIAIKLPSLQYRTTLTTVRYCINMFGLTIELDYNRYLDNEDYELECESDDVAKLNQLEKWFVSKNIKILPASSKGARALKAFENTRSKLLSNKYSTLLVDLDGTISDTQIGILHCFNAVEKEFPLSQKYDFVKFIGPPLEETFAKLYEDKLTAKKAADCFRYHYNLFGKDSNQLYDGAEQMLKVLSKHYRLIVCTGKFQPQANEVLRKLNVLQYFDNVYGSLHTEGLIHKVDIVAKLIKNENLNTDECIMIGDTVFDMTSSKANNIDAIGVLYGFGAFEDLKAHNPLTLANNTYELTQLLIPSNDDI